MVEKLTTKNEQVLIKLLNKLEEEADKEPINTFNISALSDAIKVLKSL